MSTAPVPSVPATADQERLAHALSSATMQTVISLALAVIAVAFGAALLTLIGASTPVILALVCAVVLVGITLASLIHSRRLHRRTRS